MKLLRFGPTCLVVLLLGLTLTACSSITAHQHAEAIPVQARWALLPFVNNAQSPQAGQRAEAIAASLLRGRGVSDLSHYPADEQDNGLPYLDDSKRLAAAMRWAKEGHYQYGLTGTVTEWSYKTGLDGEPAVGVTMQVIDLATGQVVWSATGAKSGWGFSSLSGTAQKLLGELVDDLPLKR